MADAWTSMAMISVPLKGFINASIPVVDRPRFPGPQG
jgi:hypothetical protein